MWWRWTLSLKFMRIVYVHNLYIVLFLKHVNNKKRLKEKLHLINSEKKKKTKHGSLLICGIAKTFILTFFSFFRLFIKWFFYGNIDNLPAFRKARLEIQLLMKIYAPTPLPYLSNVKYNVTHIPCPPGRQYQYNFVAWW